MKKIMVILILGFLLISCEDSDKTNKTSNDLIKHQETVDKLEGQITNLEKEIEKGTQWLTEATEELKARDEMIEALEKEKELYLEDSQGPVSPIDPMWNINILSGNKNNFSYVFSDIEEAYAQRTYVLGEGEFLDLMTDEETRASLHVGEGLEVSAFEIYGTVYNFTWSSITWSSDFSTYEIDEEIHFVSEISDTSLYIHVMLPEGLPYQVVSFENQAGNIISQTLSYDGYGFNGKVLSFD